MSSSFPDGSYAIEPAKSTGLYPRIVHFDHLSPQMVSAIEQDDPDLYHQCFTAFRRELTIRMIQAIYPKDPVDYVSMIDQVKQEWSTNRELAEQCVFDHLSQSMIDAITNDYCLEKIRNEVSGMMLEVAIHLWQSESIEIMMSDEYASSTSLSRSEDLPFSDAFVFHFPSYAFLRAFSDWIDGGTWNHLIAAYGDRNHGKMVSKLWKMKYRELDPYDARKVPRSIAIKLEYYEQQEHGALIARKLLELPLDWDKSSLKKFQWAILRIDIGSDPSDSRNEAFMALITFALDLVPLKQEDLAEIHYHSHRYHYRVLKMIQERTRYSECQLWVAKKLGIIITLLLCKEPFSPHLPHFQVEGMCVLVTSDREFARRNQQKPFSILSCITYEPDLDDDLWNPAMWSGHRYDLTDNYGQMHQFIIPILLEKALKFNKPPQSPRGW